MNSSQAQPQEAAPSKASIVAHPWFPKMIGLWFAALFGLCSLALAPEMLERIVTTLGLDRIVPAAAPPLGQTARLLLAMGMAGVGEIAGLLIGARLAAPKRSEPVRRRGLKSAAADADANEDAPQLRDRDRHPDAPARKPLSAVSDLRENLGENLGGIDTALRRRALASEAEHAPRPFIEVAPLPGGDWLPVEAGEAEVQALIETQDIPAVAREVAFSAEQGEPVEAFDLAQFDAPSPDVSRAQPAPFAAPPVLSATFAPAFMAPEPTLAPASPAPAEIATASLEHLGVVQLSERLALALQARRERRSQAAVPILPVVPLAVAPAVAQVEEPELVEPVAIAPVEEPLLPEPPVPETAEPEPFVAEEPVFAPAAPTPAFAPAPFAARPLFAPLDADDADEDHEIPALARSLALPRLGRSGLAGPGSVSPQISAEEPTSPDLARGLEILARRAPRPVIEQDTPLDDGENSDKMVEPEVVTAPDDSADADELSDEVLQGGYSSLLAMGLGFQRPEAVRIEEPQSDEIEPVVIFPGQGARFASDSSRAQPDASANAPFARPGTAMPAVDTSVPGEAAIQADPDETDRALRAALASLQRISGAR